MKDVYILNLIYNLLSPNVDTNEQHQQQFDHRFIFVVASGNNTFFLTDLGRIYACGSPKKGLLIMDPKNKVLIMKKKKQLFNKFGNRALVGMDHNIGGDANSANRANSLNKGSVLQS